MGEAKRRQLRGEMPSPIKISPRKRVLGFKLAHHRRLEQTADDGTVHAVNIFIVVDDHDNVMMEETPEGPKPVLIQSVAQPVRRSVLAAAGLVTR